MANKVLEFCRECNEETEHWDNREGKKNPKSPDYKCTVCGTGIWLKKETPKPKVEPKPVTNGKSENAMIMAYAKDIVVARITAGEKIETPFKCVADGFKVLLQAYYKPFFSDEDDN